MTERIYYYYRPESGQSADDATQFKCDALNPDYVVREAARHYHHRSGFDASWPIEFVIIDEKKNYLGHYEVERDVEPVFSERRLVSKVF